MKSVISLYEPITISARNVVV